MPFSVKCPFDEMDFSEMDFSEMDFGKMDIGEISFRKMDFRWNVPSVKWTFGEMSLRWKIPSAKWLRWNGFRQNGFRWKVQIPKKCTKITLAQKRICLGNLYEESDDDSTTLAPEQNSKDDYISKAEQKSLELAFARLIFRCGLFLSLSELEPVKLLLIKLLHIW